MPEEVKTLTDHKLLATLAKRLGFSRCLDFTWRDAGLVAGAMRGKGWRLELAEILSGYWEAAFYNEKVRSPLVEAPTAPRAVLLAALKAREGK